MKTYNIIASGSGGNAVLLGEKILIDCGVGWKQLAPIAENIKLVLLTHQHGDHFKKSAVKRLADEHPLIHWVCCPWMLPLLTEAGVSKRQIDLIQDSMSLHYAGIGDIRPQNVFHDVPNCCWHIDLGGYKVFYVTDTGHLTGIEAKEYSLYMIEANHTQEGITQRIGQKEARGEFCYELRAAENHLSFEQANEWLVNNAADWSEIVYLHQHHDKQE